MFRMSCRSVAGSSMARAASWRTFVNVPSTTSRATASVSWAAIAAWSAASSSSATDARSGTLGSGSTASPYSGCFCGAEDGSGVLRKRREISDIMGLQLSCSSTHSTGSARNARAGTCAPCHARHGVDHVINGTELLRMRQQNMRHRQRTGFAIGAHSGILNGFEVDDMGETKYTADHLASAEAEHVGKQRVQKRTARRLKRGDVLRSGKHGGRECITLCVLVPQGVEATAECLPEDLHLPENPFLMSDAVVRRS